MSENKVSVVIPVYNRKDVIGRAIKSVQKQTFTNWEVLVVDDGSTDGTKEVVKKFENEKIKLLECSENRGPQYARNIGIKESSGEYVAFLDSDDEWIPTKLEKQLERTKNADNIGVVYCRVKRIGNSYTRYSGELKYRGDISYPILFMNYTTPTSTLMVRRDVLRKAGGFDPSIPALQEYELVIRISTYCNFEYVNEPLVNIYTNVKNRISESYESKVKAHERIIEIVKERASKYSYVTKQYALSENHLNFARYSLNRGRIKKGLYFTIMSISRLPFNPKPFVLLILIPIYLSRKFPELVNSSDQNS